ncbi:MAG: STAS domain-containing protein [bacterium]|nr:MAG: STAS domain-containing protein [bacterium]
MFQIKEIIENKVGILLVTGEMLDADATQLNDTVKKLTQKGIKKVIVDLSGIRRLNSCFGLGVLAGCWGCMNRIDGQFRIVNPSPKVSQLLKMTKLDQVFKIYSDIEEAKKSF